MSENKSFNGVKKFHVAFDHIVSEKPTAIPVEVAVPRAIWTAEELVEFLHATVAGNEEEFNNVLVKFMDGIEAAIKKQWAVGPIPLDQVVIAQADALTDISYFNYGSFVAAGVDPQPIFDIVQTANMAKLGSDGKPIRRELDGKIMKPEGWQPPEPLIEAEIKRQIDINGYNYKSKEYKEEDSNKALIEVRQEIRNAFARELKLDSQKLVQAANDRDAGVDKIAAETMVTYGQGQLTQGVELTRIVEDIFKQYQLDEKA